MGAIKFFLRAAPSAEKRGKNFLANYGGLALRPRHAAMGGQAGLSGGLQQWLRHLRAQQDDYLHALLCHRDGMDLHFKQARWVWGIMTNLESSDLQRNFKKLIF